MIQQYPHIRLVLMSFLLALVLGSGIPGSAWGQNGSESEEDSPKIGLVLSGGGARGFAHIGVLKVLEEAGIEVDVITGSSMGSVVGGLYSIGYTPEMLEEIALSNDWEDIFNRRSPRYYQSVSQKVWGDQRYLLSLPYEERRLNLPSSFMGRQQISMILTRLTFPFHEEQTFTEFPIPFGAVVTDLESGEAVRLEEGFLPEAIHASTAIPGVFEPVKIDSSTFVDGGLARNIPASDARDMGADLVIASDVGVPLQPVDSLRTFVDVLVQSVGFARQLSDNEQRKLVDLYIRPPIEDYSTFDFDETEELINIGEQTARDLLPELKALADSTTNGDSGDPRKSPKVDKDEVTIREIDVQGGDDYLRYRFNESLRIEEGTTISLRELERQIDRIYNSGYFDQVNFRLIELEDQEGYLLRISISADNQQRIGLGARYDSHYKASVLFGAHFNEILTSGDGLTTDVRLGEQLQLKANYYLPYSILPRGDIIVSARARRTPIDLFTNGQRQSTVQVESASLDLQNSLELFRNTVLVTGVHAEAFNYDQAIGESLLLENVNGLLTGKLMFFSNTFNRDAFPSRGYQLVGSSEFSDQRWGSGRSFSQHLVDWNHRFTVGDRFTFITNATVASTFQGDDPVPLHYRFFAGDVFPSRLFEYHQYTQPGYQVQQLIGLNLKRYAVGAQVALADQTFLKTLWSASGLTDTWNWNLYDSNFESGLEIAGGTITAVGPLQVSVMTPALEGPYSVRLNIGYSF